MSIIRLLVRLYEKVVEYQSLSRSRKALRYLSDASLSDIGITRQQALAQARLPFWKKNQPAKPASELTESKPSRLLRVSK